MSRDILIRQLKLTNDWKEEYRDKTYEELLKIKKDKIAERDTQLYIIQKAKYYLNTSSNTL